MLVVVVCAYFALYAAVFNVAVAWRHVVLRNPSISYVHAVGSIASLIGLVASFGWSRWIGISFMGAGAVDVLLVLALFARELFDAVKARGR